MKKEAIGLLTLWLFWLCSALQAEPLVVEVPTESKRLPVYLSGATVEGSKLPADYAQQLIEILRFDLTLGGKAQLIKSSPDWERAAKGTIDLQRWRTSPFHFAILPKIQGEKLVAQVLFLDSGQAKQTEPLQLSGVLKDDRRQVHRLSDTLHRQLFNAEGIATTRFLYTVRTPGKELAEVWECDYDGANCRQVTRDFSYAITPEYVPGKPGTLPSQFVYVSYKYSQPRIFLGSLRTGESKPVTGLKGNQLMPTIAPKCDLIAFICDVTGSPDLFVQPFDSQTGAYGKARQVFTAAHATQGTPSFSPSGEQIAFVSDKSGAPKIYVLDLPKEGAKLKDIVTKEISRRARSGTAPCWSPDGKKIAFCSLTSGVRQIWVYDFERNTDYQLTQGPSHKENPSWGPNSFHLVFNTADNHKGDIMIVDLDNRNPVAITKGPHEKRFPHWEPRVTP